MLDIRGWQSYSKIALASFGLLIFAITSGIGSVNAQYETPNDQCGGWFRYIHGSIDFNFTDVSTSDPEKLCLWTISPTQQYKNFLIKQFIMERLPCDEYSVTISTFKEWDENVHYSKQFCGNTQIPQPGDVIEGTIMVIILRMKQVPSTNPPRFFIEYDRVSANDTINDRVRMIQTEYTWGRPTVDPLPYMGAHFLGNSLSTFGFIKANYSNAVDYEFRFNFFTITIDPQNGCIGKDFLLLNEIKADGRLEKLAVYTTNVKDTPIIRSGYGYFIVYWGGICQIGSGGGSMMYYYETIRIA